MPNLRSSGLGCCGNARCGLQDLYGASGMSEQHGKQYSWICNKRNYVKKNWHLSRTYGYWTNIQVVIEPINPNDKKCTISSCIQLYPTSKKRQFPKIQGFSKLHEAWHRKLGSSPGKLEPCHGVANQPLPRKMMETWINCGDIN